MGIQHMAHGLCLESRMSKWSYYNHAKGVYKLMNEFINVNKVMVYDAVCVFYWPSHFLRPSHCARFTND